MPVRRAGFHLAAILALTAACGEPSPQQAPGGGGQGGGPKAPRPRAQPGQPAPPLSPEDAVRLVALENRRIASLERYDYTLAEAPLREASGLAPTWIPGRVNLALALIHAGPEKRAEARALLDGVLAEKPDEPHAAFLAAW